jgi:hypothetical protein
MPPSQFRAHFWARAIRNLNSLQFESFEFDHMDSKVYTNNGGSWIADDAELHDCWLAMAHRQIVLNMPRNVYPLWGPKLAMNTTQHQRDCWLRSLLVLAENSANPPPAVLLIEDHPLNGYGQFANDPRWGGNREYASQGHGGDYANHRLIFRLVNEERQVEVSFFWRQRIYKKDSFCIYKYKLYPCCVGRSVHPFRVTF